MYPTGAAPRVGRRRTCHRGEHVFVERVVTLGNEQRFRDTATSADRSADIMQAGRVVFIAGDGRSGGTLLGQILDGLSDSVYIGELKNIWHESFEQNEPCGCGERFRHCEFWRAVVEKTFGSFER